MKRNGGSTWSGISIKIDKKYGNPSSIKLEKLDANESDDKIDGITVVWTATHPTSGGSYIIGWYFRRYSL